VVVLTSTVMDHDEISGQF